MTAAEIDREIYVAKWQTEGADPNERDYVYWREKAQELIARGIEINFGGGADPGRAYMREKLIGWQATGADLPTYGPYAVPPSPFHAVMQPVETQPPPVDNQPPPVPYGDLQNVLKALGEIKATLGTLATTQDIIDARKDFANAAKEIAKQLATGALGGIFGRREAPPKKGKK